MLDPPEDCAKLYVGPTRPPPRKPTPEELERQRQAEARRKELDAVLSALQRSDKDSRQILDTLTEVKDVFKLPLCQDPPSVESGALKTNLLHHQLQGLQWMLDHENPKLPEKQDDPPVQLLRFDKDHMTAPCYVNLVSCCESDFTLETRLTEIAIRLQARGSTTRLFSQEVAS